jgi:ATP-dependent DNA helicase RecG
VSDFSWAQGQPESETLEYKSTLRQNLHTGKPDAGMTYACLKTIAAFLNTDGGTLIIGVRDDGTVIGLRPDGFVSNDKYLLHVCSQIREALGQIAASKVHPKIESVDGHDICVVPCEKSYSPVYLTHAKGAEDEFYIRNGPASLRMKASQAHGYITGRFPSHGRVMAVSPGLPIAGDFTAEICGRIGVEALDPEAIEIFRKRCSEKVGGELTDEADIVQFLTDTGLLDGLQITYAGLILLGNRDAITRYLPNAEVVYEWRSNEADIKHSQRIEHREGLILYVERLWEQIDLRNDVQQYQEGVYRKDIKTFNEHVVREGLLNAVAHRDYRAEGSVMVKQTPRRLEILSPGGFPPGVTPDNICRKQVPRNRRLTEAMARCNLVERSGQGADLIYRHSITEGKALPEFSRSDEHQVELLLQCELRNHAFILFLSRVGELSEFTLDDLLVLERLGREEQVGDDLKQRLPSLLQRGVVERVGRGRGVRYLLSRELYSSMGEAGRYTRQKGLSRSNQKELLLKHVRDRGPAGVPMAELIQVVPELGRAQIRRMMEELRDDGRVHLEGERRGARWCAG